MRLKHTVDGISRQSLRFAQNNGVAANIAGIIPNNTYTVVILFKFDVVTGFRRLADVANRTRDSGVYIQNGRLEFESTSNPPFQPNTYIQVVLIREASGRLRAYRDGILRLDFINSSDEFVITADNILSFFQDDLVFPNEASAGNVARIRLYDAPLSTTQAENLDRLPAATMTNRTLFDFDADGKSDLGVFRPSNGGWYIYNLANGQSSSFAFGQVGDKIVPADYDGDGKTDIAVFRQGSWYLNRSTAGFTGVAFGATTDLAVPNAFVR